MRLAPDARPASFGLRGAGQSATLAALFSQSSRVFGRSELRFSTERDSFFSAVFAPRLLFTKKFLPS
jgi:hypothetical protein